MMYELPPQGRGTAEQQLAELRDYLVRMTRDLDRMGASETVIEQAANKAAAKNQQQTIRDIRDRAETLKALIIKNANEIREYTDSKVEEYNALYVAQSDFGSYYHVIERDVEDTAKGTIESYNFESLIETAQTTADNAQAAADAYRTELTGQIRRGIMEDPITHEKHLGIAISESLEFTGTTQEVNGHTYWELSSGQTLGLYTSTGWQFWINGQLCGYFSSQDNMLHVANIIVDSTMDFGTGWEITTTNGFGLRYIGGA